MCNSVVFKHHFHPYRLWFYSRVTRQAFRYIASLMDSATTQGIALHIAITNTRCVDEGEPIPSGVERSIRNGNHYIKAEYDVLTTFRSLKEAHPYGQFKSDNFNDIHAWLTCVSGIYLYIWVGLYCLVTGVSAIVKMVCVVYDCMYVICSALFTCTIYSFVYRSPTKVILMGEETYTYSWEKETLQKL